MATKIYLDPGHGGKDSGASGNGLLEKNLTLEIALKIRDILNNEYTGHSIKMSRTTDKYPALAERTGEANAWNADFYLSIHINAGGGTGYEDYIYPKANAATAAYQNQIHSEVVKATAFKDRGKKTNDLYVLRESKMPALLTENGFVDTAEDAEKLKDPAFIEKIARGHVNGLVKVFKLTKISQPKPISSSFLIRVKAQSLYYYNKPDWNARAGIVHKGEVFTVIQTLSVKGSKMYKLKSGNYMTANPSYVEVIKK